MIVMGYNVYKTIRQSQTDEGASALRLASRLRQEVIMAKAHKIFETHLGALSVGIVAVISLGGLAEIVPLFYTTATTEPVKV